MKRVEKEIIMVIVGFLLAVSFAVSAGAVPGLINYQGKLLAGGQAVTTDSQSPLPMTFRFYDAADDGTLLYEETQDVAVVDGIYSVQLGESPTENGSYGNLTDAVAEAAGIWLEIEINGETLLPRQKFTSTPYAIRAGEAEVAATVMENAITSVAITSNSVTEEKLADGAVTLAKLSTDMCAEGEVLVKTVSGWTCGTLAAPLCQPGDFINCYTGSPETMGVAACRSGVRYCNESGTGFGECVDEVVPQVETCDGVDNDCNGMVDDNVAGAGESCSTGLSGVCAEGIWVCGDTGLVCEPDTSQPEICDGIDNDCDGMTDEGLVGAGLLTSNQQGVCDGARQSCVDGLWVDDYYIIQYYGLEGLAWGNCNDGLDNDCDGSMDDYDSECRLE